MLQKYNQLISQMWKTFSLEQFAPFISFFSDNTLITLFLVIILYCSESVCVYMPEYALDLCVFKS